MALIQLIRTIDPKGVMTFTDNPRYEDYNKRPVTMQPEAYNTAGEFYAPDKGTGLLSERTARWATLLTTDLTAFETFRDSVAINKTHPFLLREPDGSVILARFTLPDQMVSHPVSAFLSALDGVVFRCAIGTALHISASATLADTGIILADGYAAVDFNAIGVLTPHLNYLIDVYDSALNRVSGFIKAAGAGSGRANVIPTMSGPTAPSGTASASTEHVSGSYPAWKAMDKVTSGDNGWFTSIGNVSGWLQYQISTAKTVVEYGIYPYASYLTLPPKDWTLQGSNDGSAWTVIDTRTGQTTWAASTENKYTVQAPGSYAYYRISVTANNGHADYLAIGDWNLYEYSPTVKGVTITNYPGGTTYNWLYKDPNFNPFDPAGFTYKIYSEIT